MGSYIRQRRPSWPHKLLVVLVIIQWFSNFGIALGIFTFSEPGSNVNSSTAGMPWPSTTVERAAGAGDGEWDSDSVGGDQLVEEAGDAQVEPAFTSIDSMLQWAIGHSDPEKLKGAAQEVQSMTAQQLEKRQAELKEVMAKLRMKSDADLIKLNLADLQNVSSPAAERQRALQGLLVLVEPIDNAVDLNKLGGLAVVIEELNRDEVDLKISAARVLGKAAQNNPVIQHEILRQGALPKLMKMVRSSDSEEAVKALYAVSATIRNFPSGQEAFYQGGGTTLLQVVLSNEDGDARLQKKALFLVADLAEQQIELQGHGEDACGLDDKLLKSVVSLIEANDLDTQEKAMMALRSLIGANSGINVRLTEVFGADVVLKRLELRYKELLLDPEQADFVTDLEVLRDEVAGMLEDDGSRDKIQTM